MSQYNKLLKEVEIFYKQANLDFPTFVTNIKVAIESELSGGINAINNLYRKDKKYTSSEGLHNLDDGFGELSQANNKLVPEAAVYTINRMLQIVGKLSFYTSPNNTGTGYDPATAVGGAWSPAAYLNRIKNHLLDLNKTAINQKSQQIV